MGVAKPVGHISAQTDTLGEDDVGFWVNGVLERQRMMQALYTAHSVWQPTAFHQERLMAHVTHGGAERLICILQPHTAWGMEPRGVKRGYQRAKHSTALKCAGNPWTKYESSFPCSSLYSYYLLLTLSLKSICLGEFQLLGEIPIWCKLL